LFSLLATASASLSGEYAASAFADGLYLLFRPGLAYTGFANSIALAAASSCLILL